MNSNLCDIYFDAPSETFRNEREEVVAFRRNDHWEVTAAGCVESTYCSEYQLAIREIIEKNPKASGEKIVIELNKRFSEVKQLKIEDDELLTNAAIALDLNPRDLTSLQNKISAALKQNNIKCFKIKNPHVSTAYLLGTHKYSDLSQTLKMLSKFSYEFKVTGVEILSGATTKNDYLVLKLSAPESFYKALNFIEKHSETIKFPGGFQTHISLFSIPQNQLTEEIKEKIKQVIASKNIKIDHEIKIRPHSVSLFNNSRLLELRQRLRQSIKDQDE